MKILIPTADFPPIEGGISTVAVETAHGLAALGHDVTVVAPWFPEVRRADCERPYRVIRYRGYEWGWLRFLPMLLSSWRYLRETDLVLGINVAYGGVMGLMARRFFGKPYLVFAYGYEFLKFRRRRVAAGLLRRVYARAKAVVAISRFTRDSLVSFGVPDENVVALLPGARPSVAASPDESARVKDKYVIDTEHVILAVGRFVARKGHETLVKAMPRILEKYPDALLVLVGRGPSLSKAVRAANVVGVRNQVLFPGVVTDEDLAALYDLCEVFALPTGADKRGGVEGFGLVFAEAQAHGKPVVAGRSGGAVEAIVDGETGILVEPKDPDALADAILSLMDDPDRARKMGEQGRLRIESELNWPTFVRRLLEIVEVPKP